MTWKIKERKIACIKYIYFDVIHLKVNKISAKQVLQYMHLFNSEHGKLIRCDIDRDRPRNVYLISSTLFVEMRAIFV
jgi:hypothetical protein